MSKFFDKVKELFNKCTSTKKANIIFMAVEIVLVLAIAGGSIAGIAISAMNSESGENLTVSSEITTVSSMEDVEIVSSEEIVIDSSTTEGEEPVVSTEAAPTVQYETKTEVVPTSTAPLTQWSEDQFLPTLPEAASVLDYFITSKLSNEELLMFTSLKGIVNKVQPRIYSCETDPDGGAFDTWVEHLELKFNKVDNPYTLIDKYKKEIAGIIIYDDTDKMTSSTINLATTIAGTRSGLVVSPALAKVIQKYYDFPVIEDLRKPKYTENNAPFTNKWDIYDYMYEHYLDGTSDRVIFGLDPESIYGFSRDYAIAVGGNVIYLDPQANADSEILNKYLSRMKPGKSSFIGWWTQENDGVNFASQYGVVTLAADYSNNLSVYAGMNKKYPIKKQKTFKAPKLENKIYIAFLMADGDNLQYCEGFLHGLWTQPERGNFPISWTMSPAMADVAKPLLSYYNKTKTDNDCIISGPSGYGYFYPKFWYRHEDVLQQFPKFLQLTDKYLNKLGWRMITVWNWETGAMNKSEMQMYADNCKSLLGISQQENMPKPAYLLNKNFIGIQLDGSYCGEAYQIEQLCNTKINEFYDGGADEPKFITAQAVPWSLGSNLSNLATIKKNIENVCGADVKFVRMDEMLQLMTKYEQSKK